MQQIITHKNIFFFGLILLAVSLPLSIFGTSMAEILLLLNWFIERKYKEKFQKWSDRPALWFITALFALHLLGLLYSTDYAYAFHDLRIKLPVLLLPLIIGTSEGLEKVRLRSILLLFCLATMISGFISFLVFLHVIPIPYYDIREISIFVSHIRLSLMVCFAVFILLYYLFSPDREIRLIGTMRILAFLSVLWLIFFMLVLKSFTGIVIFLLISLMQGWYFAGKMKDVVPRFILRVFVLIIPLLVAAWISSSISRFYSADKIRFSQLDKTTVKGNVYFNDTLSQAKENGHYVWLYVCEKELKACWNRRSDIHYSGHDKMGQELRFTLIRYLTSKGLRKDCEGVNALSEKDVHAIEDGVANYIYLDNYSLYPRVYQIIWEIDGYFRGDNPGGHSIAQRLAYLKAAGSIIRHHFIIGVGTGDVQEAFDQYYDSHDSKLNEKYRRRAHNQYVTFFVTFGIVGFVVAMWAFFVPVFYERKWHDYLFIIFFMIGLLSMLNEDTLETQTGVSFFMFFYALLLFGRRHGEDNEGAGVNDDREYLSEEEKH